MFDNRFRKRVWQVFCDYYEKSRKDYEFYNSPEMYAQSGFHGPNFRDEQDVVFHLARFCYNEFGDKWVHLNSPVYKMYFDELDSTQRHIDIDISRADSFMIKNAKRQIFVEVEWIWQGCYEARSTWERDKLNIIETDLTKLQHLLKMGCCKYAFMCIVDEEPEHTQIEKENKVVLWEREYHPVNVLVYSYHRKVLSCERCC